MTKPTGKPRGRPAFAPTPAQREKVAIWKAGGMSDEDIARVLEIDADTLKKHFADELRTHWAKKTAKVVEARYAAAIKGNVTAQTKFLEASRAVSGTAHIGNQPEDDRPARKVPKGKKEVAAEEARAALNDPQWGDDLKYPTSVQ